MKLEFRTSFCALGIKQAKRASQELRRNVRYVLPSLRLVCIGNDLTHLSPEHSRSPQDLNTPLLLLSLFTTYSPSSPTRSTFTAPGPTPTAKARFPAKPASPETTFDNITSLTLDFRGQRIEQAFGASVSFRRCWDT